MRVLACALAFIPLAAAGRRTTSARQRYTRNPPAPGGSLTSTGSRAVGRGGHELNADEPPLTRLGAPENPFAFFPTADVFEDHPRASGEPHPIMELCVMNTNELPPRVCETAFGQRTPNQKRPQTFGRLKKSTADNLPEHIGEPTVVTASRSPGFSSPTPTIAPLSTVSSSSFSSLAPATAGHEMTLSSTATMSLDVGEEDMAPVASNSVEKGVDMALSVQVAPLHQPLADPTSSLPARDLTIGLDVPGSSHNTRPVQSPDVVAQIQMPTSTLTLLKVEHDDGFISASLISQEPPLAWSGALPTEATISARHSNSPPPPSTAHQAFGRNQSSDWLPVAAALGGTGGAIALLRALPLSRDQPASKVDRSYEVVGVEELLETLKNKPELERLRVRRLVSSKWSHDVASEAAVCLPSLRDVRITSSSLPSLRLFLLHLQASRDATYYFSLRLYGDIDIGLLEEIHRRLFARLRVLDDINHLAITLLRSSTASVYRVKVVVGSGDSERITVAWRWEVQSDCKLSHERIVKSVVNCLRDGRHHITALKINSEAFLPNPDATAWPKFGLEYALRQFTHLDSLSVIGFAMPAMVILAMPRIETLGDSPAPTLRSVIFTDTVTVVKTAANRALLQHLFCSLRLARTNLRIAFVGRALFNVEVDGGALMTLRQYTSIYTQLPTGMVETTPKRPLYELSGCDSGSESSGDEDEQGLPAKRSRTG